MELHPFWHHRSCNNIKWQISSESVIVIQVIFYWPLAPPREMTHGLWNFTLKARVKRSRNRTCRTVQKLQKGLLQNLDVKANSNSCIVIHKYKFSKTCLCFFMTMIFCKSLSTQGYSGFWFFSVLCTRHKLPLNCSVDTKYLFFIFQPIVSLMYYMDDNVSRESCS